MKLIAKISDGLKRLLKPEPKPNRVAATGGARDDTCSQGDDLGAGLVLQEGMSAATARLIVERYCGYEALEGCEVARPMNRGRYFRVRLSEPDGRVSRELLVDKQSGQVICSR